MAQPALVRGIHLEYVKAGAEILETNTFGATRPRLGAFGIAEKIKEIDQNNDGKLTAAEHAAGTEKMFDKMDTNHDGFISKEECAEGMKLMKKGT